MQNTALFVSVWPRPGKEPLVDVERTVLVAVHHQVTVLAAICPFPKRHCLHMFAGVARFGRIAFTNNIQFFPKAQTLVGKHLHKAIKTPIIIYHSIANAPLVPLFGDLLVFFLDDHLPLGEITDHHSSFSQLVCDEVGGFVQTVLLFVPLTF